MEKDGMSACAACGIAIDPATEQVMVQGNLVFCAWCWSNDCCRVSRDAAEQEKNEPIPEQIPGKPARQ